MNEKTYDNNLKTIKEIAPDVANQFVKCPENLEWTEIIKAKNNTENLMIKDGLNTSLLYDNNDPKINVKNTAKSLSLGQNDITVLIGIGLGYLTKAIINKMHKNHHIIVVEPCIGMLKYAFKFFNFTKYLKNGSLIICTNKDVVPIVLATMDQRIPIENWTVLAEGYTYVKHQIYKEISKLTSDIVNQIRCNTGTISSSGNIMARNDIINIPYLIRHRGVDELLGVYKEKPAIIVSTGPSLEKNIHLLKNIQDKVIIIAVAQALRILYAYEIIPDFICTVDFGEVNFGHLRGLMDSKVPLVATNRTYGPLLKAWVGPKFVVETPIEDVYKDTAAAILKGKGVLDQGGSVSHSCLGLAMKLGCNPITLIGQDLAMSDGKSHIPQVDAGGKVTIDENGMAKCEVNDPRWCLHKKDVHSYDMGPAIPIQSYWNDIVYTNIGLQSFITSFEKLAELYKNCGVELMNSTCGGADIKNYKKITLHDYIEKYCKNIIDKSVISPLLSLSDTKDKDIEKVIPMLEEDIKVLDDIFQNSKKGLVYTNKILDNLNTIFENKKKLKTTILKVEGFSIKASEAAKKNPLVRLALYGTYIKIENTKYKVSGKMEHILKNKETLKIRCERNKLVMETAEKESNELLREYRIAKLLLTKYKETKDNTLLMSQDINKVNFEDVNEYFDKENWTHPLVDANRVLYWNNKDNKYFYTSRIKYNDEIINKANEVFKKAVKMREDSISKINIKFDKEDMTKHVEYLNLIEESRKLGAKKIENILKENNLNSNLNFIDCFDLINKAISIYPDKEDAYWGLATVLKDLNKFDDSIKEYKKLINRFPNSLNILRYEFELGLCCLLKGNTESVQEGLQIIDIIMKKTNKYDSFLRVIGDLCSKIGLINDAIKFYSSYLEKFPYDEKIKNVMKSLNNSN